MGILRQIPLDLDFRECVGIRQQHFDMHCSLERHTFVYLDANSIVSYSDDTVGFCRICIPTHSIRP